MKSTEAKKLIGKKIYLIPQGNNISRGKRENEEIIIQIVEKVGTTKITTNRTSFYMNGSLDNGNYGYLPFATKQEADDYIKADEIRSSLKYNVSFRHLNLVQLERIMNIVNEG